MCRTAANRSRWITPALWALMALIMAPGVVLAQEQVLLRLDSPIGESLTYRFEIHLDIAVPPMLGGSQQLETLMVVQQTTTDVRGDTLYVSLVGNRGGFDLPSLNDAGQRISLGVTVYSVSGDPPPQPSLTFEGVTELGIPGTVLADRPCSSDLRHRRPARSGRST